MTFYILRDLRGNQKIRHDTYLRGNPYDIIYLRGNQNGIIRDLRGNT